MDDEVKHPLLLTHQKLAFCYREVLVKPVDTVYSATLANQSWK